MTTLQERNELSPGEVATPLNAVSPLTRLFKQFQPTPETAILLLAILVGLGAGTGVVMLRFLIHWVHLLTWGDVSSFLSIWGHWTLALIPLIGGSIIGLMRWRLREFGPGLGALMETVQRGREILPLKPVTKMLAAAISLGSGASLGPEGPSVEIGANFSLLLGQALRVSQDRLRLLLGAGAAAGLAAGFNAPIAGVFFALEVVLGTTFATSAVSVVLLASVVAAWISQIGLGSAPAFSLPAYEVRSLLELPFYIGLGIFASLISIVYKSSIEWSQRCFQGNVRGAEWLRKVPQPWHPVLGGLAVGLVALHYPQVLGVGYETVESILQDVQFPLYLVFLLLLVKLVMTAVSFGSGFVGGIFAPALFLGASLGSAYGKVLAIAFPILHPYMASPPAYAMVGMAAVLASTVRAPLTAILLLFELTHDYRIVLPLMGAVGFSVWLTERLQPSLNLDSDGEKQQPSPVAKPLAIAPTLTVKDAIEPLPIQISGDQVLTEVGQAMMLARQHCALVMDGEELLGLITLQDLNRLITHAETEGKLDWLHQQPIRQLCTTELLFAYEDEALVEAIARMLTRGLHQLPVAMREPPHRIVGLLTPQSAELTCNILRTRELLDSSVTPEGDRPLVEAVQVIQA